LEEIFGAFAYLEPVEERAEDLFQRDAREAQAFLLEAGPVKQELLQFAGRVLPPFMVPAVWVVVPRLPLLPNGKLDRRSLPRRAELRGRGEGSLPETRVEQTIAAQIRAILDLERVYRHDHFFDLGGHSLTATQLVSRLNAAFDLDLGLPLVFENPTVAGMADVIEARLAVRVNDEAVLYEQVEAMSEEEALKLLAEYAGGAEEPQP
jgi:acyl carrier protein